MALEALLVLAGARLWPARFRLPAIGLLVDGLLLMVGYYPAWMLGRLAAAARLGWAVGWRGRREPP